MRLKTPCFLGVAYLLACPSNGLADDSLRIENIADGDNVVVLMDSRVSAGRTWWCSNDEVLRTTGIWRWAGGMPPGAATSLF